MSELGRDGSISYSVAGTNLEPFVRHWLTDLCLEKQLEVSLLSLYGSDYEVGAHLLMGHIAPVATYRGAVREVLLLFAVLATFQSAGFPARDEWTTPLDHVDAAFEYARQVGEQEMAHRLLVFVASERTYFKQPKVIEFKRQITNGDPARLARHEARIEATLDRNVRAARILDPQASMARARAELSWMNCRNARPAKSVPGTVR